MLYKYTGVKKYYNDVLIASPDDILDIDSEKGFIYNITNNTRATISKDYVKVILVDCKPATSKVEHPSHYTWLKEKCGIEVIDITRHMDFDLGNAIKYILRCGHKSEEGYSDKEKSIEDLKKAIWYINDKIKNYELLS